MSDQPRYSKPALPGLGQDDAALQATLDAYQGGTQRLRHATAMWRTMHQIVVGRRFASRTYSRTVSRSSSRVSPRAIYRGCIAVHRAHYDASPSASSVASDARSTPRAIARATTPCPTRRWARHQSLCITRVPRRTPRVTARLLSRAALGTGSRTVVGDFQRGQSGGSTRPEMRAAYASFHALLYVLPNARPCARSRADDDAFLIADDSALIRALISAGCYALSPAHDVAICRALLTRYVSRSASRALTR